MKTSIKSPFLLLVLLVGVGLTPAGRVTAQTITTLHIFNGSDGGWPFAGLIILSNTLYGTASRGSFGNGTVFAVHTNGTGFTNLHSFTDIDQNYYNTTNSDGAVPQAGLIVSGNTLYGTASDGGSSGDGTVFAVNTDGTGFTNLHSFTALSGTYPYTNSDGATPEGGLLLSDNTLFGTTFNGGSSGNGTVFSLSFRPQLTIIPSGTNVILSWPISYAGFSYAGYYLEETANLGSPTGWSAADPFPPVIVNGQLRVTRPMLGPQISYRLRKF